MDSPISSPSDPRVGLTPCFEPEPELVGAVLGGRYKIRRRVASGGMATVYLAKDERLRCQVAIKVLRRRDAEARRRFWTEGEVLGKVRHPHLVRVVDSGRTDDDRPFLVLDYLDGETLGARLARRGALPWREVVQIGVQLAGAVAALHAAGVIHRDIKPHNVIALTTADGTIDIRLIDLGLARPLAAFEHAQDELFTPVTPRRRTELGCLVGTPEYLPPEAGECEVHVGFDVFALATTLYQLCTGRFPRGAGFQPLHVVRPECDAPPDLSRLLLAALAPDPADRLPSAEQLARGLAAILAAHPEARTPEHLFGGCYDRLELLGTGRCAAVFRASDRGLQREVALKVLRERADDDDRSRFILAARILAALRHPNIPRIHHAQLAGDELFVATELCPGVPASDFVRRDAHLRSDEVIAVGLQLVDALAAIHKLDVVYRDLHVGNVLIDRRATPHVSLFDFDRAEVSADFYAHLDERYATPPERKQHPPMGLDLRFADYAAPEVRAGGPYTAASDVFALGLLLYRLLTGERPFPALGGAFVSACERCACPEPLDDILAMMLNADPAERPTLAEVKEYLELARDELEAAAAPTARRDEPAPDGPTHGEEAPEPTQSADTRAMLPTLARAGARGDALSRLAVAALAFGLGWAFGAVTGTLAPRGIDVAEIATRTIPAETAGPAVPGDGELCEPALELAPMSGPEPTLESSLSPPAQPGDLSREVASAFSPDGPDAPGDAGPAPKVPRRPARRSSTVGATLTGSITQAAAEAATRPAGSAMQGCPGVPAVIIADLDLTRGRASVRAFNGHPLSPEVGWHDCARRAVEALAFPMSDTPSRVRVRLRTR